jgi:hypothetical protein
MSRLESSHNKFAVVKIVPQAMGYMPKSHVISNVSNATEWGPCLTIQSLHIKWVPWHQLLNTTRAPQSQMRFRHGPMDLPYICTGKWCYAGQTQAVSWGDGQASPAEKALKLPFVLDVHVPPIGMSCGWEHSTQPTKVPFKLQWNAGMKWRETNMFVQQCQYSNALHRNSTKGLPRLQ